MCIVKTATMLRLSCVLDITVMVALSLVVAKTESWSITSFTHIHCLQASLWCSNRHFAAWIVKYCAMQCLITCTCELG